MTRQIILIRPSILAAEHQVTGHAPPGLGRVPY